MTKDRRFSAEYNGFQDHKTGRRLIEWFEIVRVLNELADENEQLKEENKGIQDKVMRLLDFVEAKQCVTRTEIKEWWNSNYDR